MSHYGFALTSLIAIAILWVTLFWLYRDYCVDLFRQRMFALRDELFDEALRHNIPFDHGSYGVLRVAMNGFIRFAHQFNLAHFIIVVARHEVYARNEKGYSRKLEESMLGLTAAQKGALNKIKLKMSELLLRHILLSSPISVMTIIVPIVIWLVLRAFFGVVLKALKNPLEEMTDMALVAGAD